MTVLLITNVVGNVWYINCIVDTVLTETVIVFFRLKKPYGAMYYNYCTLKVFFYQMTPILVCSTKYIHPWFIEFVVFKHCTEQLMERKYSSIEYTRPWDGGRTHKHCFWETLTTQKDANWATMQLGPRIPNDKMSHVLVCTSFRYIKTLLIGIFDIRKISWS
jgi:hypothetical protein